MKIIANFFDRFTPAACWDCQDQTWFSDYTQDRLPTDTAEGRWDYLMMDHNYDGQPKINCIYFFSCFLRHQNNVIESYLLPTVLKSL